MFLYMIFENILQLLIFYTYRRQSCRTVKNQ